MPWVYYAVWLVLAVWPMVRHYFGGQKILAGGYLFWGLFSLFLIIFRYGSHVYDRSMDTLTPPLRVVSAVVMCATVLLCTLPMGMSPRHNGEMVDFHYQYEGLTEQIAEGQLHLKQTPPEALVAMENPYDFEARQALGLTYEWDTALYDGHYYVYFGVAPVVLLFLPYKLITGRTLLSYHGTQLFTALFIIGLFLLFHTIAKRFFPKTPYGIVLALSTAFSVMSVFFATGAPALYCTAITCGICFQVWSFYFHIRAVYLENTYRAQTVCAVLGSVCGALVFASRPPVGLAAFVSVPMLLYHIRRCRDERHMETKRLVRQVLLAALPYVLVAIPLMCYNAARFDNPFEFGQAYMLTNGDLTVCKNFAERFDIRMILDGIHTMLFRTEGFQDTFPYFRRSGVFANFPVLLFLCALVLPAVRQRLKERGLLYAVCAIPVVTLVMAAFETYWVTEIIERYRMDVYFLLGTGCFITALALLDAMKNRTLLCAVLGVLAVYTLVASFFLYLIPEDQNTAMMCEAFYYWTGWALSLGKAG